MSLTPVELTEILSEVIDLSGRAGAMLLAGLDHPKRVSHKGAVDLVTEYDRRSESLIVEGLLARFPGFGILAEEGTGADTPPAENTWVIDPLDGTTNFAHGHPVFAVSIGLEHAGCPVLGVIEAPALGRRFWATAGRGAFCNGARIRVSTTTMLDEALLATGYPYDRRTANDDNAREHIAFMKRSQGVRRCGAAAIDLAFVAAGVYDGFWEPRLKPWDLAAGTAIAREAGALVTGYDGSPLNIREGWVVAANPAIHPQMLELLSKVREIWNDRAR